MCGLNWILAETNPAINYTLGKLSMNWVLDNIRKYLIILVVILVLWLYQKYSYFLHMYIEVFRGEMSYL